MLLDAPVGWCGVDEAGRGPLAGNVVAAAVILDPHHPIAGLNDSKKLSARQREILAAEIHKNAVAWSIGRASPFEIDGINILKATFLAMRRAVQGLTIAPLGALVDGNRDPKFGGLETEMVVKGDGKIMSIAAASILAKTERDAEMRALAVLYPHYGFEQHMGYPTAAHLAALQAFGPCPVHRKSFGPVAKFYVQGTLFS
jgi:ribonuclease HII